jgi:antitoxin component of RelBE/YafQ-DinJ toxin-antitoxin module
VADETTPTPTSEPTPNPAPSEPAPAAPAEPEAPAQGDPAPKQDEGDVLSPTALGNGDPEPKPEGEGEGEPPQAAVPETYELTAPEGFEKLDDETVAAATPVFKELGLTNEQANKLMPVAKRIIAERDQQFLGTILEQRKSWLNDARADKEIGGGNWDASMQASAKALDTLGFPKGSPLRNALDESGFGNHPELIRLMARVGKAVGEDSDFVRGDANAAVKPKSDAELFYGPKASS